MRYLVGEYPCTRCGGPAKVRRRAEIPQACCEVCKARSRAFSKPRWADEAALRDFKAANEKTVGSPEFLIGWLRGLENLIQGSRHRLEALPVASPAEARRLAIGVTRGMTSGAKKLAQLVPIAHELQVSLERFELIKTDDADLDLAEVEARSPAQLRIVPPGSSEVH